MDIKLLPKLIEIKKQEVHILREDFSTLEQIATNLNKDYTEKVNFINEFIQNHVNNHAVNLSAENMLNSRFFLNNVYKQRDTLQTNLTKVELQRDAAFESLKAAAVELKVLEKLMVKKVKLQQEVYMKKHQLNDDDLALTRYHRGNTQI